MNNIGSIKEQLSEHVLKGEQDNRHTIFPEIYIKSLNTGLQKNHKYTEALLT